MVDLSVLEGMSPSNGTVTQEEVQRSQPEFMTVTMRLTERESVVEPICVRSSSTSMSKRPLPSHSSRFQPASKRRRLDASTRWAKLLNLRSVYLQDSASAGTLAPPSFRPLRNIALRKRYEDGPLRKCFRLLRKLMTNEYADPFNKPVDRRLLPDYYVIVRRPMDFGTIKLKFQRKEYRRIEEFCFDVKLIFRNCYRYNSAGSPLRGSSDLIEKQFDRHYQIIAAEASGLLDRTYQLSQENLATFKSGQLKNQVSTLPPPLPPYEEDEEDLIPDEDLFLDPSDGDFVPGVSARRKRKKPKRGGGRRGGAGIGPTRGGGGGGGGVPELTRSQKEEMARVIPLLSEVQKAEIVRIVAANAGPDGTVTLNLEELESSTMYKLYQYVLNVAGSLADGLRLSGTHPSSGRDPYGSSSSSSSEEESSSSDEDDDDSDGELQGLAG